MAGAWSIDLAYEGIKGSEKRAGGVCLRQAKQRDHINNTYTVKYKKILYTERINKPLDNPIYWWIYFVNNT
jgi:hypothetical protein